jgi:magnesium and cobalt transporter
MDSLRVLAALAGLVLVFAASLAAREPIRHPRRTAGSHESEAGRVLHRGLTIHVAVTLAACAGVIAAPVLGRRGFAAYLGGLAFLRLAGFAAGSRYPWLVRFMHPMLAPTEGAALLIDWFLTPLFRRAREPQAEPGNRREAYEHVLDLTRRTVEKVMIPRSEVIWLKSGAGIEEIIETVRRRPHSRYPVFEGDAEHLVGMLGLFDLLAPVGESPTAGSLARPGMVIPETMGCDHLLEKMRAERFDTAVVIDEFGAVAGLVTLEDLLEVIIGELAGEHETVPVRVRRMEDGSYLVDGAVRIEEFEDLFGVALPEGDYETVAGLFLSRTSRIPGPGEKLVLEGVRMEVAEATATRIRTLHVVFAIDAREPLAAG